MSDRYDCIVIGCGPAGLSAALNLNIRNKSFLILGTKQCSHRLAKAERIDNYLGLPEISGQGLMERYLQHVRSRGIELREERVTAVYPGDGEFAVITGKSQYSARSLIIATGVHIERVLPGENEYLGKGVSYCATCDGPLFREKAVALLDYTGGAAHDEVLFLAGVAKQVYYVLPQRASTAFVHDTSAAAVATVPSLPGNTTLMRGTSLSIKGTETVSSLIVDEQEIAVDGVFILRETQKAENLVPGLATDKKAVAVNGQMETNIAGVFAAGDCTGKPYQLAKATGQGAVAALSAVGYLDKRPK
ncbi:FAD-dependent oxidoreductase [Heliobacterium gestii]|uniref:FAD-dependent oxidoreductase n=1 Tax=Heliomicrobium gestii TaxID=2699 RepID=A0A845LF53_HELGE|nr:NAD(P)/FAD-dependent oxidoreductase [Heliomicrobium gestii]MBM7865208.1 thioredoxin reductase (NADPH) [Heliomicrobium gestii]MZP41476.1 FAD-dependent oxidoreductase [Heliomicrobium gestii]